MNGGSFLFTPRGTAASPGRRRSPPLTCALVAPYVSPGMPSRPALSVLPELPEEVARHLCTGADLARRGRNAMAVPLLPTGVPPLDRLLGGGLPRGGMVELSAHRSSGRHSLGLAALAAVTSTGEPAALVDLGSHLDPRGAAEEGVDLGLLLWIRPRRLREALSAAEIAVTTGFPLVVLDLGLTLPRGGPFREEAPWLRLARTAQAHESALLVLSPFRLGISASAAVVTASFARPTWILVNPIPGSPGPSAAGTRPGEVPLLAGLSSTLTLEKRRGVRPGERTTFARVIRESVPQARLDRALARPVPEIEPLRPLRGRETQSVSGEPAPLRALA